MNIIMISIDLSILNKSSVTYNRLLEQSKMVDNIFVILYSSRGYKNIIDGNLYIFPTNSFLKLNFFKDSYFLGKQIIKNNNLEIFNTIITTQDPFETGLIGYFLKRKYGFGLNIQDHGNFFESKYWKKETILNFMRYYFGLNILQKANSIRVVSIIEKIFLEKKGFKNIINVSVYTNPIHIKKDFKRNNTFSILMLSRFVKQKNIILSLSVLKSIYDKYDNINLTLIGDGEEKKILINYIEKNNLNKKIILKEWTDNVEKEYRKADLLLLTSNYEGWGRTIIESAYCGVPSIMTNTGCAGDFLINNYNGIVIGINNKKELERGIIKMYEDENFRKQCIINGYKQLEKLPNKQETLKLYKKSWELALISSKIINEKK